MNKKLKHPDKLWTIGHSTLSIDSFLKLLKENNIQTLADVRSIPYSRRNPQFNKERLQKSLMENGINYIHIPHLGGKRPVKEDSETHNIRNKILKGFIDHLNTDEFDEGIEILTDEGNHHYTAIMCAEKDWTKCHRAIISDQLKFNGTFITHIIDVNKTEEHQYTKGSKIKDNTLFYL